MLPEPNLKSKPQRLVLSEIENTVDTTIEASSNKTEVSTAVFGIRILPFHTSLISSIVKIVLAKNRRDTPIEYSVISQGRGIIETGITSRET